MANLEICADISNSVLLLTLELSESCIILCKFFGTTHNEEF